MKQKHQRPKTSPNILQSRRSFISAAALSTGGLLLSGCDRIAENENVTSVLASAEGLSRRVQRALLGDRQAPEFPESMISADFRANGSTDPQDKSYLDLVKSRFAGWRLSVDGLVDRPAKFSLAQLRAMTPRTQITRHDCVEGWSCIGKWKGAPLGAILENVGVKTDAQYVIFHCADTMDEGEIEQSDDKPETKDTIAPKADGSGKPTANQYYESIDLADARHPQTILAYDMNDKPLTVPHGAPLRVRIERQLGYKMAKYILRIELVSSLAGLGQGKGGYWEDRGYEWYAGI